MGVAQGCGLALLGCGGGGWFGGCGDGFGEGFFAVEGEDEEDGGVFDLFVGGAVDGGGSAEASHEGDVLFAVGFVGDGWGHAGAAGLDFVEFDAFVGAIDAEHAVVGDVHD